MNKLPLAKRVQILSMLVEGSSMRSISRVTGVAFNTIDKLLQDAGAACADFHNRAVRGVNAKRVQADEIWAFCYSKQKNVPTAKNAPEIAGDAWTWTAIDADSKLVISFLTGNRDAECALALMDDLRRRVTGRMQLTTDGLRVYVDAVEESFGTEIDYAQLVKIYGAAPEARAGRYSPAECIGARKQDIAGSPDPKHVSTSYVERANLSMRTGMRRFTRLSLGFSKRIDMHCHALALYFVFFNFVRIHKTLRTTPAMAAGITKRLWEMEDIAKLIDTNGARPAKRGPYKKRGALPAPEISN
jgi:IS1 family transposase